MSTAGSTGTVFLRSRLWPVGLAGVHLLAERALFLTTFPSAMRRFDMGEPTSLAVQVLEAAAWVLSLPLIPVADQLLAGDWLPGLWGYALLALNSLCWGFALWLLTRLLTREARRPTETRLG